MADYIPGPDSEFDEFYKKVVDYVDLKTGGNFPVWTHIPSDALSDFHDARNAWTAAYEPTKVPHTPVQTAEKNRVRDSSEKNLRDFVNRFLRYAPVTNTDRDNMGIPNRDPKPTPVPSPKDVPEVEVSTPLPRTLRFKFKRMNAKRWGKPKGIHGFECKWVISDTPPAKIGDLLHSDFATKNPLELVFDEDERGKRVYYAVRWETGAMKKGPWSDIFSAIIP